MGILIDKYVLNHHTGQTGIRIRNITPSNSQEIKSKPSDPYESYAKDNSPSNEGRNEVQEHEVGCNTSKIADDYEYDSNRILTKTSQNYAQNMSAYEADDSDDTLRTSIYRNLTIDAITKMQDSKTFRLVKGIVYGQKKNKDGPIGVYRTSENSDTWNCNICKHKGDIFSIVGHVPTCLTRYNNEGKKRNDNRNRSINDYR
jgi:hypothetical protein